MSDLRGALYRIYDTAGELTPQLVVDDARPVGSPLHNRFEWNDEVAGEQYRLVQAQKLIRSVRISVESPVTGEKFFVREFTSNTEAGDTATGRYTPTEEIVTDDQALKLLLLEFQREIEDLKKRYGHLEQFADLMRAAGGEAEEPAA